MNSSFAYNYRQFTLPSILCIILAFSTLLLLQPCAAADLSGQGQERNTGRLIHGKYFGPLNETSSHFPRDISSDKVEIGWIPQPLDHFSDPATQRRWNQKFARNGTYFLPGGPACIFIGGEGRMDPRWIVAGQMVDDCQKLNGVLYILEHRYYGESRPTINMSTENLKYLTITQALADITRFIEFVHFNEMNKVNQIILFGGSYAGTLVAYFNQKFPGVSQIAVASSAPIQWIYDFTAYNEVIGQVLKKYGNCYDRIKSGMKEMERIISRAISTHHKGPINDLLSPLKLCSDFFITNKMDVPNFYSGITGLFGYYVQYNGINGKVQTVEEICEIVSEKNATQSDFEMFANLITIMNLEMDNDCFSVSNEEYCDYISQTGWDDNAVKYGSRAWSWQVCSEVASFQTTNSKNQPFVGVTTELFVKQCQCAFGKKFTEKHIKNAVQQHLKIYGGYQASRPKVIYANGDADPWSALGVINFQQIPPYTNSPNVSVNCVILIKNASHCNDMLSDHPKDSLELGQARQDIFNCITNWM